MTRDDVPEGEVVTVVRLVPLGRAEGAGGGAAIVASAGTACLRIEGDSIFLVGRQASPLVRLEVGDMVHWIPDAEPFGVLWRAEREGEAAGAADFAGYFRGEARYVYMHAAYRARGEGSRDTILGIAERFEQLGDVQRAEQVRRIAGSAS